MANTIYGVLYSFITLLPLMLIFDSGIMNVYLFPLILVAIFIPVFTMYGKKNLYNFEDSGNTVPIQVVITPITICIALYFIIPISVLTGILLITLYNFVILDGFNDYSDQAVIKVRFIHLSFVNNFVNTLLTIKLIVLILVIFLGYFNNPVIWVLSYIMDIYTKYRLRNDLFKLNLFSEGYKQEINSKQRDIFVYIIILISLILSNMLSSSKAIVPYTLIIKFLKWLYSLGGKVEEEMPIQNYSQITNFEEQMGIPQELMGNSDSPPEFLKIFFIILEKVFIIGVILLIIYFLLYPLIAPLLKLNVKTSSLKEYYLQIIHNIVGFFNGIKKAILEIFNRNSNEDYIFSDNVKNSNNIYYSKGLKHKREIKILLRYYIKLVKWSNKKSSYRGSRLSINDFFNSLDIHGFEIETSKLNDYFNRGFFSDASISNSEFRDIKNILKVIIKK